MIEFDTEFHTPIALIFEGLCETKAEDVLDAFYMAIIADEVLYYPIRLPVNGDAKKPHSFNCVLTLYPN